MKKPKFIPSGAFKSKPELPDNLEDAHRLLAQLREYHDSLQIEASHLQSIVDEGANARLAKKLQGKIRRSSVSSGNQNNLMALFSQH